MAKRNIYQVVTITNLYTIRMYYGTNKQKADNIYNTAKKNKNNRTYFFINGEKFL